MPAYTEPAAWALPGLETSSGCFETMRVYAGTIFRLPAHLERLYASAQSLGVRLSDSPAQLSRRLNAAVRRSGLAEAVIRVAMIPSAGGRMPARVAFPSIVVQPVPLPPAVLYRRGLRVAIVPTKRFPITQINPQAKFSARQGSVMAVMDAQLRQVDEAIFLDERGYVTESTASNLGLIKDGRFIAPPCWMGLLPGITWLAVEELAPRVGLRVEERPVTRHELYNADEVLLTSTIKEVIPVTQVDGRRIGTGRPGALTARLRRAFRELVRRELRGR